VGRGRRHAHHQWLFLANATETGACPLRQIATMATQAAAIEAARSNARSRTLERLSEIEARTLIIQGRYDRVRTPEHGAEMRDRIPGARLEVLEGSGHTPHLEEPEAFHRIALPFLLTGR